MNERPKYTVQGQRKASGGLALRGLIAIYLLYLGWGVIRTAGREGNALRPWMSWAFGLLFFAVAVGFGLYAYRCYKADLKAAEVHEDAPAEQPEETEQTEE